MSRRLKPLQLVTNKEDYQVTLPMQLTRAEAKVIYTLLQRRITEDLVEHDKMLRMHDDLLAKLYYFITDTPLP